MAAVSSDWAYHLSTPTDTDTDTVDAVTDSQPLSSAMAPSMSSPVIPSRPRRHLSLVRHFTWCEHLGRLSVSDAAHAHRLITTLTGVEQLQIQVQTNEEPDEHERPPYNHTAMPIHITRTWLPRCTRLRTLEWMMSYGAAVDETQIQHMQHTLSHLSPTLNELRLKTRSDWWDAGTYTCVMAALPPLSLLHVDASCDAPPRDISTYRAMTHRHAATLHTFEARDHKWSWAAWGQLGEMTCITELDVSQGKLPIPEAADQEHVTAVTRASHERMTRANTACASRVWCVRASRSFLCVLLCFHLCV